MGRWEDGNRKMKTGRCDSNRIYISSSLARKNNNNNNKRERKKNNIGFGVTTKEYAKKE